MKYVSKPSFEKTLKGILSSTNQQQYKVRKIALKAGVNLRHKAPLTILEANEALKNLKTEFKDELKTSSKNLTVTQLRRRLTEVSEESKVSNKSTGPSKAVLEGRKKLDMRDRMKEDEATKARIAAAFSKSPENDNVKGAPKPSAPHTQTPALRGSVIGEAAQRETEPARDDARGMFGGERSIAPPAPPVAHDDEKPSAEEVTDIFGPGED